MLSMFNTLIQANEEDSQQRVSTFGVGVAPEAMSGKALVGKSRTNVGICPFIQPHRQAWVTTECQRQKSQEENKIQVNNKERKTMDTERTIYFSRSISKPSLAEKPYPELFTYLRHGFKQP